MLRKYYCDFCGARRTCGGSDYPLRTKCLKSPSGYHNWVKMD